MAYPCITLAVCHVTLATCHITLVVCHVTPQVVSPSEVVFQGGYSQSDASSIISSTMKDVSAVIRLLLIGSSSMRA